MMLREPLNPVVQNALILLASSVAASVFCASVYGATLPVDEAAATTNTMSAIAPQPQAHDDAAAAAALRAMLIGQPPLFGVSQPMSASAPQR